MKVILDTNALIMPFQFGLNLESELKRLFGSFEAIVPSSVLDELRVMRSKRARAAERLAARFSRRETGLKGDAAIVSLARELDAAVLTNDRELISELKSSGIPVVRLRSRNHLVQE